MDPAYLSTDQAYSYAGGDPVDGWDPSGKDELGNPATLANPECSGNGCRLAPGVLAPLGAQCSLGCSMPPPPTLGCYKLEDQLMNTITNQGMQAAKEKAWMFVPGSGCDSSLDLNLVPFLGSSYVSVCGNAIVAQGCVSITSEGSLYVSGGATTPSKPGLSLSIGSVNSCSAGSLIGGWSFTAGGAYVLGGGYAYSPSTGARGPYISLSTPGASISATYGWRIFGRAASQCC